MDLNAVEIERWRSPASSYPRAQRGRARIRTAWYKPGYYACYEQRGFTYFEAKRRLYVTALEINGDCWMVDDPPHWWAMEQHAAHYTGHVLCAGLGLGLMVHALTDRASVHSITVVEREQDVIDLVQPLVPHDKLTVIHGDFFDVAPTDLEQPVDGVLFDLLVGHGPDLVGVAIRAMVNILRTWERDDDGLVARIHGMPSGLIDNEARAMLADGVVA